MAATGYTPISLYYTTTAAGVPLAANLVSGELAINITDGKLFYKNASNVVTLLASASGASGDVSGPVSATDNALVRFDATTGKLIQNSIGILSDAGVLTGLTGVTSSGSITFSGLTSGRVTYASTGGLLADSANLTFNGTILTAGGFAGPLNGTVGATTPAAGVFTTATARAAATQDSVILQGRAGGTNSYGVTLTPTTLTANRTITFADANINFATGLGVAQGGTGTTTSTGSGSVVLSTSPTLVTPILGTPTSGNLANCTFPTLNQNTTGTASNITGNLAVTNLNSGTGASSSTFWRGDGTWAVPAGGGGGGTVTSVSGTGTVNGITLSGTVTTTGNLTLGGTLSGVSLTSQVSGTLPVANGGTGTTTSTGTGSVVLSTSPTITTPTISGNTSVGGAFLGTRTSASNVAFGNSAGSSLSSGLNNTAMGGSALAAQSTGDGCTAFGYGALISGNYNNSSGFGSQAAVTGDNQVQLGNSATTTYVYGTVQNRSDIRDKADVRDTQLGLNFVNALRPVDYKLDMRDDYKPPMPEDTTDEAAMAAWRESVKVANLTHDGSKKRIRYHHGLIAQEVKAVLDAQGIDFGGYQDHKVNGGDDVLTIGYDELIAPLIKAIQELTARVQELEAK